MRPPTRRASGTIIGVRGPGRAGDVIIQAVQGILIVAISAGLLWLVWIYGNGLRDPRYFDGWVLAGGMSLQLGFHIAIKTAGLSPKSATRWKKVHVLLGYVLVAAFISHSDFTLPDTAFEWALWAAFVLVTVSGIFGTYLAWALKSKRGIDESISYDRIPARRAELAQAVRAAATSADSTAAALALPVQPHDAWVTDLYATQLRDFFQGQRNTAGHLVGSQRHVGRLTGEIDSLSRYVSVQSQQKLAVIKELVIEKDRLDFARVYLGLSKGWLYVHVPVTYALIVLTVVHVLVAYAYSSGDW